MSTAPSSPLPGWWQRTWPLVALGVLSVSMWVGRIRNIAGDEELAGMGRALRLGTAVSFVVLGALLLVACWIGQRNRNWRGAAHWAPDGWRVSAGVPEWGRRVTALLVGWTAVVWLVLGVGIALDPNHDLGFKVVHVVLMASSLLAAAVGVWGLRRSWPVVPTSQAGMPG